MSRLSVDPSHPRPCAGGKTFRRFRNVDDADHIILIDVDAESSDNVVIIDVPESMPRKNKGSRRLNKDHGWSFKNVICIDDDDDDDGGGETHEAHAPSGAKSGSSTFDASRQSRKRSSDSEEEGGFVPENINPVRLSKCKRTYSGKGSSSNSYGLNIDSESESLDDDSVDCEIMEDSSGKVKEVWERAFSKRMNKSCGRSSTRASDSTAGASNEDHVNSMHHNMPDTLGKSGTQANAPPFVFDIHEEHVDFQQGNSRDHVDERGENPSSSKSACEKSDHPIPEFHQTTPEVEPFTHEFHHNPSSGEFVQDVTTIKRCQNIFESKSNPCMRSPAVTNERFEENRTCHVKEMDIFEHEEPKTSGIEKDTDEDPTLKLASSSNIFVLGDDKKISCSDQETSLIYTEECIISEREKLKETDEYKKALEEEWASRRQALQIQAEEAQRQRRLLKRQKAESLRLLDMERRQKERVEEVRNTQKKDEENMNLKVAIQSKVREKLKALEVNCHDLATLLHLLGIKITGWPYPSPQAVQAAYKRALLTYHPDRTSQSDLHRQVEAEETFKLINRFKEKFSPSL